MCRTPGDGVVCLCWYLTRRLSSRWLVLHDVVQVDGNHNVIPLKRKYSVDYKTRNESERSIASTRPCSRNEYQLYTKAQGILDHVLLRFPPTSDPVHLRQIELNKRDTSPDMITTLCGILAIGPEYRTRERHIICESILRCCASLARVRCRIRGARVYLAQIGIAHSIQPSHSLRSI